MNVVGQTINWRKLLIFRNPHLPLYMLVKRRQNLKCYNAFAKHLGLRYLNSFWTMNKLIY